MSLKIALAKIREYSKSHIVHDGLHQFKDAPEGFKLDYRDVPGLSEYSFFLLPTHFFNKIIR